MAREQVRRNAFVPRSLARNGVSMAANQAGLVLIQAGYFILLARSLGVSQYGAFAAVAAVVGLIAPFGSLGSLNLMIRNVSRDRSLVAQEYANAVGVTLVTSAAITGMVLLLTPALAPASVSVRVVFFVLCGDLLGARLVIIAGGVFQALEAMARTATFTILLYGARLLGIAALVATVGDVSLTEWAAVYGITALVIASVILIYTARVVGWRRPQYAPFLGEWNQGLLFSIGFSAQTIYNDIDKAMLGRLSTLESAGVYTTAYRIVDMAFTPMRALLAAAYSRFFLSGERGITQTAQLARRLARPGVAYCLFASLTLFVGAGAIPVLFGESFSGSVGALRGLALLPLLKALHYLAADALTGAGLMGSRTAVQVFVAVVNIALNIWLIPAYSWRGAVASSLVCDGLLVVGLWLVVWRYLAAQRDAGTRRGGMHRAKSRAEMADRST